MLLRRPIRRDIPLVAAVSHSEKMFLTLALVIACATASTCFRQLWDERRESVLLERRDVPLKLLGWRHFRSKRRSRIVVGDRGACSVLLP